MTEYVHFSSRPEAPQVPPRAINTFSGGSGPLGVYAYQTDAHSMTFGADRPYAFLLTPTVPVTSTAMYSEADLARDLARLAELEDIARPLRLYDKWRKQTSQPGPPFHKLWYVLSKIPLFDDEPPSSMDGGFANPRRGRELLLELGHQVIDDRRGVIYGSEPEQAVFLTDDSFQATPVDPVLARRGETRRNPRGDAKWEAMRAESARLRSAREAAVAQAQATLEVSPAILGRASYGDEPRMAIKSGELSDHAAGRFRVTFFGPDGPHGHSTRDTDREIAEVVVDSMQGPFAPMTDAEVMAFTQTPAFLKGSRVTAFVQAENKLRWFASKAGRSDWAQRAIDRANDIGTRGGAVNVRGKPDDLDALDAALDVMHAAIRELPVENPRRHLVSNPAWVTSALAKHYEQIDTMVPPRWMPQLARVTHERKKLVADLLEFGCGAYGCVIATNDPSTVLKVTTDDTEAEFAATMASDLVAPIVVDYRAVITTKERYKKRVIHLLWREAADHVGKVREQLGDDALALVQRQHRAGQAAFKAAFEGQPRDVIHGAVARWLEACEAMARGRVPEIRPLGRGLVEVYERQGILFGDIHDGNLGVVHRPTGDAWVITDPGHVAVVDRDG